MYPGQLLKYGQVNGGKENSGWVVASGQLFPRNSGKWVYRTGASTSTVTKAVQSTTPILGWLNIENFYTNSTLGTEVKAVITDPTAVFRMPIVQGTAYAYMIGKSCDIVVSSYIQYAAIDSSTYDQLLIVDIDTVNSKWADVRLNPYCGRSDVAIPAGVV
jgi:hypothetical protein